MPSPVHWAGFRDAPSLGRLLKSTFAPQSRWARWRFSVKVVTTPHLTTSPPTAVVGVSPVTGRRPVPARLRFAVGWFMCGQGRAFNEETLPAPLRRRRECWRAMNLAAVPGTPSGLTLRMARTVVRYADRFGVSLELEAAPDPRLAEAYMRHGFVRGPEAADVRSIYRRVPRRSAAHNC